MEPLPPLPLADWEPTKVTLHLWAQIVGKVKMASVPPKNHWWHVPLYLDVHGLTTRLMHAKDGTGFEIRFDFVDHRLVVETAAAAESFALEDGLTVAAFDEQLHATLRGLGVDVTIVESPFGVPVTTPFTQDAEHASYDPRPSSASGGCSTGRARCSTSSPGWFCGKQSPVHLFWHGLDLALTRFSGRQAPPMPDADAVTKEAYSQEVVSFGIWAGDATVPEPTYYSYTAPEPAGLRDRPLAAGATWIEYGAGSLAVLPYETVRTAADPHATLLEFLESAYQAGAGAAGWDTAALASSWCPA